MDCSCAGREVAAPTTPTIPSALMSKRDLDLHLAAARGPDAVEDELAEELVVGGALALALEHRDAHRASGRPATS